MGDMDVHTSAGIYNGKQQREYSRILENEGIDRADIVIRATMESLKFSGIQLVDAVAILESARGMLPKEDVPLAKAYTHGSYIIPLNKLSSGRLSNYFVDFHCLF
jgi:hypothetical protein